MKEVQLKLMKGEISKISSLTLYRFTWEKLTGRKTYTLWRFIIGNVASFLSLEVTQTTSHNSFNFIMWVLSCLFQC